MTYVMVNYIIIIYCINIFHNLIIIYISFIIYESSMGFLILCFHLCFSLCLDRTRYRTLSTHIQFPLDCSFIVMKKLNHFILFWSTQDTHMNFSLYYYQHLFLLFMSLTSAINYFNFYLSIKLTYNYFFQSSLAIYHIKLHFIFN